MEKFARLLVQKSIARAVVAAVLVLAAASVLFARRVQQDDDLLAFLPRENADVRVFYDVNRRFGGLETALVGIQTKDPFAPEFLHRLQLVTKKLNQTEGVAYGMSLTNIDDFVADPEKGGISTGYLIPAEPPVEAAARAALREKVMSRPQVVGNLIAEDGQAVLIYGFPAFGADAKVVAKRVRDVVTEGFPSEAKYWGGTPFISGYIYDVSQRDIRTLAPWAGGIILLITFLAFRDAIGTALALASTGLSIVFTFGLMGALGVTANVVMGSMPVVLFALGSAFAVPIMLRYYALAHAHGNEEGLVRTLVSVGPTVLAGGLTSVAALLSLLVMNITPMRTFGLFTAFGLLVALTLSLTFIPAVIRLAGLKGRAPSRGIFVATLVKITTAVAEHRAAVGAALAILAIAGAFGVTRVQARMDNAAFYSKGSPPDLAEAFLRDHFGGAQFFQLEVEGDLSDPGVLREVRGLADSVAVLPHVTSTNNVSEIVATIDEAMEGSARVPDTGAQVKLLFGFLEGKRAVSQLTSDDHRHALIHIKIDAEKIGDLESLLAQVEQLVKDRPIDRYEIAEAAGPRKVEVAARLRAMVATRLAALARRDGVTLGPTEIEAVKKHLEAGGAVETTGAEAAILAFLRSEEFIGDLPTTPADAAQKVASSLATIGARPTREAIAAAIAKAIERPASDAMVIDLVSSVARPLQGILAREAATVGAKRMIAAARLTLPAGMKGARFVSAAGATLMDLDAPTALLPAAAGAPDGPRIGVQVTGLPVMNRGLSQSVAVNQQKSIAFALVLVVALMSLIYRSIPSGLLAASPVLLTLLLVYGAMGALAIPLEIGTSMLASLITGAGVNYAAHLLAAWRAPDGGDDRVRAAAAAAATSGPAIATNAIMVCAGFLVLTRGEAKPLQSVGGLTAAAMLTAALATFVAIPVLARRRSYVAAGAIDRIDPARASSDPPEATTDAEAD
ncbi:MAG: MMPL family transporter [Byssovorax sp.]